MRALRKAQYRSLRWAIGRRNKPLYFFLASWKYLFSLLIPFWLISLALDKYASSMYFRYAYSAQYFLMFVLAATVMFFRLQKALKYVRRWPEDSSVP